jgi:4-hydroxythreonine-4-phosphate dehydrogenase
MSRGLPLALTLGEPAGIGPDLTLELWRRRRELGTPAFYVTGDAGFLRERARLRGLDVLMRETRPEDAAGVFPDALPVVPLAERVTASPGRPDASTAPAVVASIRTAVEHVLAGRAAAVVTNPIAKAVLYQAGFEDPGHTEYLARLAHAATGRPAMPVMLLWSPALAVVPVTIHIPLRDVVARLTRDLIVRTGRMPAKLAPSDAKTSRSSHPPSPICVRRESTCADRSRPTPSSMRRRVRPTTSRCACITTRR